MQFTKDFTGFPTRIHRAIYAAALRLTPLEISLAGMDDPNLAESCRQYHAFVLDLLSDMYADPQAYGMDAGEYEAFLDGRAWSVAEHQETSKSKALRGKEGNALPSYLRFLKIIGTCGELERAGLVFPAKDLAWLKNPKGYDGVIPYKTRVDALRRVGLAIGENPDGTATVTSGAHPAMLPALSALAKSTGNTKTFGENNFFHCEFRQLRGSYIPTYEDVVLVLPDDRRAAIDAVRAMAERLKLRPSCSTYWKVNFHYKSKHVMMISTDNCVGHHGTESPWCNSVMVRVGGSKRPEYLQNVEAQGEAFVRYFRRHLQYCRACSTGHIGGMHQVLGKTVRLCGGPGYQVMDPGPEDLKYIRTYLELRMEEIRAGA